jgi:hypothetical protein
MRRMSDPDRMSHRRSFDRVAELHETARPGYPRVIHRRELVDRTCSAHAFCDLLRTVSNVFVLEDRNRESRSGGTSRVGDNRMLEISGRDGKRPP